MTNTEESSKPYFRLLSESDAGSENISFQVATLFRLLNSAYPDPVVEPTQAISALDGGLAQQIVNWLKSEHFIKVEDNQVWLTLTGCESIRAVCRADPAFNSFFSDPDGPLPHNSTELVLALLKTHFTGGRAAGR
ncbi:MAG: hypothetical protein HKN05_11025 [Rhizobiales bacterium]|nr:hypothetical protein [Hyphomicrobiales bacterium]